MHIRSVHPLRSRLARAFVLTAAVVGCGAVSAQQVRSVTEADMEKARKSQPTITDADIQRAQRLHAAPLASGAELARPPSTPRVDAPPQPAHSNSLDLGAIAEGFKPGASGSTPGSGSNSNGPALLVFISFAIPQATLTRLVDQAAASGATLVLRGLVDGSIRDTAARVQQLVGNRQVAVQIDPLAFDRYAIEVTPTFVLTGSTAGGASSDRAADTACQAGRCAPPASFVGVAGDVSLDFALEHLARTAPQVRQEAGAFLKRMRTAQQRKGGR